MIQGGESIQVEEGKFARIHNDILNALAVARFSGSEYRCLMFLFRKTYGWGKKQDRISMSQWAEGTGIDESKRHNVLRTIQGLVKKGVIYVVDNGNNRSKTYGFVKYFERWDKSLFSQTVISQDNSSVMQADNTSVMPQDNSLDTTVMPQDNKTVIKADTHKRKKDSKAAAATTSDQNVTSDQSDWKKVTDTYHAEIGVVTPTISELMQAAYDEMGATLLIEAIQEASRSNVRRWSYIASILNRWRVEGKTETSNASTAPIVVDIPESAR